MSGLLDDLRVVQVGGSLPVAYAANFFADLGADVILIEPPGGSPLRSVPGYRFLARGTRSVVLDLHDPTDAATAFELAASADVFLTSLRTKSRQRFGLEFERLEEANPGLVYGAVSGWGSAGSLRDAKGYEGMVLAKIGANFAHQRMVPRPGPAFLTVPFASWSAGQTLLHGVLAALRERQASGSGQYVESNLAQSLGALDPWNQANAVITQRFPDAFTAASPIAADGSPYTSYTYKLLVAVTKDGHWLQFSEVQPRLFDAFVDAAGLAWMKEDPKWSEFITGCIASTMIPPNTPPAQRMEFWDVLLTEVRSRTLAEWQAIFDEDPNVFAEVFRRNTELLHHPQLAVERQTLVLRDREVGDVLQPGALIRFDESPAAISESSPLLDEHGAELREEYGTARQRSPRASSSPPVGELPLAGVTILELGTFYAAPYGATVLTDLGARVIKIEPLSGDPMRVQQAFPEAGAMKVLQGKESVALDLAAPESKDILQRIAAQCDIALCSFRMGVAHRLGVGPEDLREINPNLMYLEAPGFGVLPPYGNRPAFAPTIAAGSGIAMRNAGSLVPEGVPEDLDVIRGYAGQLSAAGGSSAAQPDGVAALAVGTAIALAALLQSRGVKGQHMLTTMLQSCAHCLAEDMVEYDGRPAPLTADAEAYGLSALYRLYEAADGWIFLAAPSPHEWESLVAALTERDGGAALASDSRFATADLRQANDAALAEMIAGVIRQRTARDWETDLIARDIGCVVAESEPVENLYVGEFAEEHAWLETVESPVLGDYPRIGPMNRFSRSATAAKPGCMLGQHTVEVLREFGYSEAEIGDFVERKVVLVG